MPDGTVQKLTRLQVSLRDVRADHKKNYPAQCDFLSDMLSRDPAMRPSCEKILSEISEKCSNLAQREENRRLAQIAAENIEMNYPQSSERSGTPVPALPELDQCTYWAYFMWLWQLWKNTYYKTFSTQQSLLFLWISSVIQQVYVMPAPFVWRVLYFYIAAHSSSTTPRPTEVPPSIYSKDRLLYSIYGDNTPVTSAASHHSTSGTISFIVLS